MIALNHISKSYHAGSLNEIKALDDVSIHIRSGEFVVVVGSNGSGKTSLLNVLAGSIHPDSGTFSIENKDISALKEYERSPWISRIFQNPLSGSASDLSILDNFRLASIRTRNKGFNIGTGTAFRNRVKEKISILNLGLENKLDQGMGTLSGGQRQALTLLMATMDETKMLLMDEPTAALDPRTSTLLMELAEKIILELKLTTILVTHQLKDVIRYGDRVIQLREGKIIRSFENNEKKALKMNDLLLWFGD